MLEWEIHDTHNTADDVKDPETDSMMSNLTV